MGLTNAHCWSGTAAYDEVKNVQRLEAGWCTIDSTKGRMRSCMKPDATAAMCFQQTHWVAHANARRSRLGAGHSCLWHRCARGLPWIGDTYPRHTYPWPESQTFQRALGMAPKPCKPLTSCVAQTRPCFYRYRSVVPGGTSHTAGSPVPGKLTPTDCVCWTAVLAVLLARWLIVCLDCLPTCRPGPYMPALQAGVT